MFDNVSLSVFFGGFCLCRSFVLVQLVFSDSVINLFTSDNGKSNRRAPLVPDHPPDPLGHPDDHPDPPPGHPLDHPPEDAGEEGGTFIRNIGFLRNISNSSLHFYVCV